MYFLNDFSVISSFNAYNALMIELYGCLIVIIYLLFLSYL